MLYTVQRLLPTPTSVTFSVMLLLTSKPCSFFLDGKIFQEKVQSIMYLRNSSSGGKSIDSPTLAITSPTGFSAAPQEGKQLSVFPWKGLQFITPTITSGLQCMILHFTKWFLCCSAAFGWLRMAVALIPSSPDYRPLMSQS